MNDAAFKQISFLLTIALSYGLGLGIVRVVLEFSNDNLCACILLYIFLKCELSIMFKISVHLKLTSIFRFFIFQFRV